MMTAPSRDTKSAFDAGSPSAPLRRLRVGLVLLYVVLRGIALFDLEPAGDLQVYWAAAQAWNNGLALWREAPFEYPPGALLLVLPPSWFTSDLASYTWAFALQALLIDVAVMVGLSWLAQCAGPDRLRAAKVVGLYILLTGLLGELLVQRLDVMVALLAVAVSVLLRSRAPYRAVVTALAALTLFKLVGLLLAPLLVFSRGQRALEHRGQAFASAARDTAATAAVAVLGTLPFLPAAGSALLDVLRYHSARGLQLESTWASVILLLRRLTPFEVRVGFNFGATHLGGGVAELLASTNPLVVGAALLVVFELARARRLSFERAALVVWLTFMLVGKVLSPQFLLWVTPWLALLLTPPSDDDPTDPQRQHAPLSLPLVVAVFVLTGFLMHFGYGRLAALDALAGVLLLLRNLGLGLILLGVLGGAVPSPLTWLPVAQQRVVAWASAACLVVLAAVRDVTSFDFWLHRFIGAQIVATGAIPTVDHYSAATEGQPFVAHEWLSATLLFLVDDAVGAPGLIALRAVVLCAIVALLHLAATREVRGRWWWWLLLAATLMVLRARLQLRPHLFAMLLMAMAIVLIHRARARGDPRWLLGLVPLEVLWANLHASCVLLPALLLSVAVAQGLLDDRAAGSTRRADGSPREWALAGFACALATLCNPRGATLWSFAIELFFSETPRLFIDEWRGAVAAFEGSSFQLAFVGVLAAYGWALWLGMRDDGGPRAALSWPAVVGLFGAALGLTAVRFQAPMTLWLVAELAFLLKAGPHPLDGSDARIAPSTLAGFAMLGWIAVGFLNAGVLQLDYSRDLPWSASQTLSERHIEGVVFNEYDDGGFLLARHWPRVRPVVDGRVDVLGDAGVLLYRGARADVGAFKRYLEGYCVNAVLLRQRLPFNREHHRWLQRSAAWEPTRPANDRVLYLRRSPWPHCEARR